MSCNLKPYKRRLLCRRIETVGFLSAYNIHVPIAKIAEMRNPQILLLSLWRKPINKTLPLMQLHLLKTLWWQGQLALFECLFTDSILTSIGWKIHTKKAYFQIIVSFVRNNTFPDKKHSGSTLTLFLLISAHPGSGLSDTGKVQSGYEILLILMCPRSSDQFYIVFLLYKSGYYFLDIHYQ